MVFVPIDKKVSVVPDLSDLPITIEWPRDTRPAKRALIISGIWMIFVMGLVMALFIFATSLSYGTVAIILGILTLADLLLGISALRLYASKDEITISQQGLNTKTYSWLKTTQSFTDWAQIARIQKTDHGAVYETLELMPKDDTAKPIPVLLTRNKGLTLQIKLQLEQFLQT